MLAKKRKNSEVALPRNPKSSRQIEKHIKGVANHRRIEILFLIADNRGITVDEIARKIKCNVKTASDHIIRLTQAGLIRKSNRANRVSHELSPYGQIFYKFLNTFRNLK